MRRTKSPAYMSADEAAKALGIPRTTLCWQLQQGRAPDLGMAVQMPSGRWRYYIYRARVKALAEGGGAHGGKENA